MRFTIKPMPLLRMLEMVGQATPGRKPAVLLRLIACQGRVCVESGGKVAEADAAIWEDGQCDLSPAQLANALKAYRQEGELTIEAEEHGLRLGGRCIPVSSYCPYASAPAAFQIFMATDLGCVSRGSTRPILA